MQCIVSKMHGATIKMTHRIFFHVTRTCINSVDMRAGPLAVPIYTDIPYIYQSMHIVTIEGLGLLWRQIFCQYLQYEVGKFLKDGLTKCAAVLPSTDTFLNAKVETLIPTEAYILVPLDSFKRQIVFDNHCHLPRVSVTKPTAYCVGTEQETFKTRVYR